MTIGLRPTDGDEDGDLLSTINTTPLVDIMLVLLIIFLITVPVVIRTVPVNLPHETSQPTKTTPDTIVIAVDKKGNVYWNDRRLPDYGALFRILAARAADTPQPEVQIRADKDVRYEFVGRVVVGCKRAGITKVGFITEPAHGDAASP